MGVINMRPRSTYDFDPEDPMHVAARAFTATITLHICRNRLVDQTTAARAVWSDKLKAVTKEYREILRDDEHGGATDKAKARAFDKVVKLVAKRDKIEADKKKDMTERATKLGLVDEALSEAFAYRPSDPEQMAMHFEEAGAVQGMPWATDKALGVLYTALLDLEESGASLDEHQAALLMELADTAIEGADLGLEVVAAIEDDSEAPEFSDEEAGIPEDAPNPLDGSEDGDEDPDAVF